MVCSMISVIATHCLLTDSSLFISTLYAGNTDSESELPITALPCVVHCAGFGGCTLKHVRLLRELNKRGESHACLKFFFVSMLP